MIESFTEEGLKYQCTGEETDFLGQDITKSDKAPVGGWIKVEQNSHARFTWSSADLLWARCKMFVEEEGARFASETLRERNNYQWLMKRLKEE